MLIAYPPRRIEAFIQNGPILITNANAFDGVNEVLIEDANVVVNGSIIEAKSSKSQDLALGTGEKPDEILGRLDPRIPLENIGADRLLATRAGVEALRSSNVSLATVIPAAPARSGQMSSVCDQGSDRCRRFADGVMRMVVGFTSTGSDGQPTDYVEVADQRAAVTYLASKAIADLEPFSSPPNPYRGQT